MSPNGAETKPAFPELPWAMYSLINSVSPPSNDTLMVPYSPDSCIRVRVLTSILVLIYVSAPASATICSFAGR
jgi:hypothetical protein